MPAGGASLLQARAAVLDAGNRHPPVRRSGAPAPRRRATGRTHGPRRAAHGRAAGRRCVARRRAARAGPHLLPQAQIRGVGRALPERARPLRTAGRRAGNRAHAQQFPAEPDLPGPVRRTPWKPPQRARDIFERLGDRLRLARLDANMGNILYRQDRFEEALELYQRAYRGVPRNRRTAGCRHLAEEHRHLPDQPQRFPRGAGHLRSRRAPTAWSTRCRCWWRWPITTSRTCTTCAASTRARSNSTAPRARTAESWATPTARRSAIWISPKCTWS